MDHYHGSAYETHQGRNQIPHFDWLLHDASLPESNVNSMAVVITIGSMR